MNVKTVSVDIFEVLSALNLAFMWTTAANGVYKLASKISQFLTVSPLWVPSLTKMLEVGYLAAVGDYKVGF